MCVGCGRCIDACAGESNIRDILKKLYEEPKINNQVKFKNGLQIPTNRLMLKSLMLSMNHRR